MIKLEQSILNRFLRFLLVGGLNTLFGYSIFAFLIYIKIHYAISCLLSQILGTLFNFKTYGVIVFGSNDNRLIFRFIAVYGISYLVNVAGLTCFDHLGLSQYLAGAVMILPCAILTFFLMRKFVFMSGK